MDNQVDQVSQNLATNLANLRFQQGLSQKQLAEKAEIPRSTLTYIESGMGNPSISSLVKVAAALSVSLEELISSPKAKVKITKASDVKKVLKSRSQVEVSKLLPEPIKGMEIDRMDLAPRSRMRGTPHLRGTREFLYCLKGRINIYVGKEKFVLEEGDLVAFPGDEAHAYENRGSRFNAICFSVVALG